MAESSTGTLLLASFGTNKVIELTLAQVYDEKSHHVSEKGQ